MASSALLFLKITDTRNQMVQGEAEPERFLNQIEVDDWSWSISMEVPETGGGKRPEPALLSISKGVDRASPRLMSALASGEVFPSATLSLVEDMEETEANFDLTIVLTQLRVVDYELTVRDEEKQVVLDESYTLNYATIDFLYDDGKQQVSLRRPPDSGEKATKSDLDDVMEDIKTKLKPAERKQLVRWIGTLDA